MVEGGHNNTVDTWVILQGSGKVATGFQEKDSTG